MAEKILNHLTNNEYCGTEGKTQVIIHPYQITQILLHEQERSKNH